MKQRYLLLLLLLFCSLLSAQEICDNGIDDDGDGDIDLFDTECNCSESETILLEDFEDNVGCPTGFTPCSGDPLQGYGLLTTPWVLASTNDNTFGNCNSPDYLNTCGFLNPYMPSPLIPSGEGAIGFVSSIDFSEGIAQCLECSLIPRQRYDVSFYVGFGTSTFQVSNSPVRFGIYGKTDCSSIPVPLAICPEGYGWTELGTFQAEGTPGEWVQVTGSFTPEAEYQAIMFMKACSFIESPNHPLNAYHFVDRLEIRGDFKGPECVYAEATLQGDCLSGYTLMATPSNASQYQWYRNNIAIDGATSSALLLSLANLGEYKVRITFDDGRCAISAPVPFEASLFDGLDVDLIAADPVCFGEQTGSLQATVLNSNNEPFSFSWNTGDVSQELENLSAAEYSVTVTDSNGCFGVTSTTLEPLPEITIELAGIDLLCFGDSSGQVIPIVTPTDDLYTYNWEGGSQNSLLTGLSGGSYVVTVTNGAGCTTVAETILFEPEPLTLASTIVQSTLTSGGGIEIFVTGGTPPYQYLWDNGATASELTNLQPGVYTVNVNDANDCTITTTLEVTPQIVISDPLDNIYIPNVFSPNRDGVNDRLKIFSYPSDLIGSILSIKIYDRWGSLLHVKKNVEPGSNTIWDGRTNNLPLNTGVYVYLVEIQLHNGDILNLSGDVMLLL